MTRRKTPAHGKRVAKKARMGPMTKARGGTVLTDVPIRHVRSRPLGRVLFGAGSGARDMVQVPRAEYEALLRRVEDLEDAREMQAAEVRGLTPDALPAALVDRLLEGESPVRVWREHRGLTLAQLADQAGVGTSYISEIETKKKPGSVHALRALAQALKVDLGDLVS